MSASLPSTSRLYAAILFVFVIAGVIVGLFTGYATKLKENYTRRQQARLAFSVTMPISVVAGVVFVLFLYWGERKARKII